MMRVISEAAAQERARLAAEGFLKRDGAAGRLQKSVRAKNLRRMFQDTTDALVDREKRRSHSARAARAELRRQQEEESAARAIQRRNRAVVAKRDVQRVKSQKSAGLTSASNLLDQVRVADPTANDTVDSGELVCHRPFRRPSLPSP